MAAAKLRADLLLVERGLCASRTAAQQAILAGQVRVGADHVVQRPHELVAIDAALSVEAPSPYVSRGAYKLLPSLERYLPDLSGLVALDVGASTGGFTDLMLQRGARRVYAVDVGHGQLHYRLRQDARVVSLEKVNARYLVPAQIPEPIDVLTADVSFISLTKVLPAAATCLRPGAWAFVLVKPQFEAGPREVAKGVVRAPAIRARVLAEIQAFATSTLHWTVVDATASPILGPKGNEEWLAVFRAPPVL